MNTPLWLRVGTLGMLVLAALLVLVPPARAWHRGWKVEKNYREAFEASSKDLPNKAREHALEVYRGDPSRTDILPILLRATDALSDPRRAGIARDILNSSENFSKLERLAAWRSACGSWPTARLLEMWGVLPENAGADPSFVAFLFDRLIEEGSSNQATDLLENQPHPLPPPLHRRLMELLVQAGSEEAHRHFQENLRKRIARGSEGAGNLIPLLDPIPQSRIEPTTFEAVRRWSENQADQDVETLLRLARGRIAASPGKAEVIFSETLERHRADSPYETARWCLRLGRYPEAADLMSGFDPSLDARAFEILRALHEATGDLEKWAVLLESPPSGVFAAAAAGDRAHVARMMGDRKARLRAEEEALRLAAGSLEDNALIRLARHAMRRSNIDFADRLWVAAIRKGTGPLPLGASLTPMIERLGTAGNEVELLDVMAAYRELEPYNTVFQVQHAYLSCVTGRTTPDRVIDILTPIHEEHPTLVPIRCALALAYLLDNRPDEALLMTGLPGTEWNKLKSSYQAIRAISLSRAGRGDEALHLLDGLAWDAMLPSEKRVLQALIHVAEEESAMR